jgi:hypothetical protein
MVRRLALTIILYVYIFEWFMVQRNGYDLYEVLLKLQHGGAGNLVETDALNHLDSIAHLLLLFSGYLEVL